MKINIPFLKVPYFTTIVLLIILFGPMWSYMLDINFDWDWADGALPLIMIFLSSFYLTARAVYIKKYFWAWVMGGIGIFFNPIIRVVGLGDNCIYPEWPTFGLVLLPVYILAGVSLRVTYSIREKTFLFLQKNIKKIVFCCVFLAILSCMGIWSIRAIEESQKKTKTPKTLTDEEVAAYDKDILTDEEMGLSTPRQVISDEEMDGRLVSGDERGGPDHH